MYVAALQHANFMFITQKQALARPQAYSQNKNTLVDQRLAWHAFNLTRGINRLTST
jgi:hypothetical protein